MTDLALPPTRTASAWRGPAVAVVALIALLLLRYRETALAMVDIWSRSETFTHAFVVPPITLWLIWRQRDLLKGLRPRPVPWMLLVMAALALLWWLGDQVSVNAVTQLTLTAMVVAAVPTVLGWQVARALMFPLGFLFFAVPIGEFLTPTLVNFTADFTVAAVRLSGVPVFREGNQFIIPSGSWSVIEECSGIRYLMASFMVGSLFAYLNYQSYRRRLIFIACSIVVPVLANWLRAYLIVMIGHLSSNRLATGVDHIVYGWVFFGIVIMALFFVGARWAEPDPPVQSPPADRSGAAMRSPWTLVAVVAACLLILQLPFVSPGAQPDAGGAQKVRLPDALALAWRADAAVLTTWRPTFVGATQELNQTYASGPDQVGVYLAYYRHQSGDSKLVSSVNILVRSTDDTWHQVAAGRLTTATPLGDVAWHTAQILPAAKAGGGERQRVTVWRAYWIGGRLVTSDVQAKLLQAWLKIQGQPDDAAAVLLYSTLPDAAAANRQLSGFASANLEPLLQTLAQARARR
jgi:exosortase A